MLEKQIVGNNGLWKVTLPCETIPPKGIVFFCHRISITKTVYNNEFR
jgi:hypothetical protein